MGSGSSLRRGRMCAWRQMTAWMMLGLQAASAQQILMLDPGGVVVVNNNIITTEKYELAPNGMSLLYKSMRYPNGGPGYFAMRKKYSNQFDVIDRISVENGLIRLDGLAITLGVHVERIDVALRWGEQIACLGHIPHMPKHWYEPKSAQALMIFSPQSRTGAYRGLFLDRGSFESWAQTQ